MPDVDIDEVTASKTLLTPSPGSTKKYKKIVRKKIIKTMCKSS